MSVKRTQTPRQPRMHEAPQPRPRPGGEGMRLRSPSEVLAILQPTADEPRAIRFSGLWKTGLLPEPQGAV